MSSPPGGTPPIMHGSSIETTTTTTTTTSSTSTTATASDTAAAATSTTRDARHRRSLLLSHIMWHIVVPTMFPGDSRTRAAISFERSDVQWSVVLEIERPETAASEAATTTPPTTSTSTSTSPTSTSTSTSTSTPTSTSTSASTAAATASSPISASASASAATAAVPAVSPAASASSAAATATGATVAERPKVPATTRKTAGGGGARWAHKARRGHARPAAPAPASKGKATGTGTGAADPLSPLQLFLWETPRLSMLDGDDEEEEDEGRRGSRGGRRSRGYSYAYDNDDDNDEDEDDNDVEDDGDSDGEGAGGKRKGKGKGKGKAAKAKAKGDGDNCSGDDDEDDGSPFGMEEREPRFLALLHGSFFPLKRVVCSRLARFYRSAVTAFCMSCAHSQLPLAIDTLKALPTNLHDETVLPLFGVTGMREAIQAPCKFTLQQDAPGIPATAAPLPKAAPSERLFNTPITPSALFGDYATFPSDPDLSGVLLYLTLCRPRINPRVVVLVMDVFRPVERFTPNSPIAEIDNYDWFRSCICAALAWDNFECACILWERVCDRCFTTPMLLFSAIWCACEAGSVQFINYLHNKHSAIIRHALPNIDLKQLLSLEQSIASQPTSHRNPLLLALTAIPNFPLGAFVKKLRNSKTCDFLIENASVECVSASELVKVAKLAKKKGKKELMVQYLQRAAEGGHCEAMSLLGECLQHGLIVEMDHNRAVDLFLKAGTAGCMVAQRNYALTQPPEISVAILQQLVEAGDPLAACHLSECYRHGVGVAQDETVADALLYYAGELGEKVAYQRLAEIKAERFVNSQKRDKGKASEVMELFSTALRDANQVVEIGIQFEEGRGVPQCLEIAAALYGEAVKASESEATRRLAEMLRCGRGVNMSYEEAADLYCKVYSKYANDHALDYEKGTTLPQDTKMAATIYRKCQHVSQVAMVNLGRCLHDGIGTPEDPVAAVTQYHAALNRSTSEGNKYGRAYSLMMLAFCADRGCGCPQDKAAAADMYAEAKSLLPEKQMNYLLCTLSRVDPVRSAAFRCAEPVTPEGPAEG
ncbi:cobalamin biosynthesis protein CobT [Pelomyxa schiedti]|nr:cobalamin biosynthesis protein CobT [Pelomyxa schiedti]